MQQNRQDSDFCRECFSTHWNLKDSQVSDAKSHWISLSWSKSPFIDISVLCLDNWSSGLIACLIETKYYIPVLRASPPAAVVAALTSHCWGPGSGHTDSGSMGSPPRGGELCTSVIGSPLFNGELHPCALRQIGRWCKWSLQSSFLGEETGIQRLHAEGHTADQWQQLLTPSLSPFKNIAHKHWAIAHDL